MTTPRKTLARLLGVAGSTILIVCLLIFVAREDDSRNPRRIQTAATEEPSKADAIRRHMEVLASDYMRGRLTGTPGYDAAASYVTSFFEEMGVQPAGDEGTYLQHIDFYSSHIDRQVSEVSLVSNGRIETLEFGEDFVQFGGFLEGIQRASARLVFVGHGIQAERPRHDDYANVDVDGKIAVVLTGAPPSFASDERAYYSSSAVKEESAARNGAVAILTIRTPVDSSRLTWPRMNSFASDAELRWVDDNGVVRGEVPGIVGNVWLSSPAAKTLFEMANRDLDTQFDIQSRGTPDSFEMDVTANIARGSRLKRLKSHNVLGLVFGSDPELRDEFVLVSAHLDHLGQQMENGVLETYNGAYDNAAGVGVILELARELVESPPRRSVLFAAYTAEEQGLRGSDYMANHPPVPIESIVANLNIDMPFLGHTITDIEGLGVEHSSLEHTLQASARRTGLTLTPDPRPELVRLIRSDQFSFVKKGIPGLNLKPGSQSIEAVASGRSPRDDFLENHYHYPTDDLSLPYSTRGAARYYDVASDFLREIANADDRPTWNENDFFAQQFGE